MTRKGQSITLSLSAADKAHLQQLADDFGQSWGNKPNISKLIKAIAGNELRLAVNHDWPAERIDALNRARGRLVDIGEVEIATAIATLLLERSELTLPLRQELEAFVERPAHPWRLDIDRFIQRHRPFELSYQDAAGRIWEFTIRYAKIVRREDREYLDCWCDQTEGNQDLPKLSHNWTLRLDRIPAEAVILPAEGSWRPRLPHIDVELHLLNGLAYGYRTKRSKDIVNEWHPEIPKVRRVVRQVTSTFWFFREIRRYAPDCVIVSPSEISDRYQQTLMAEAKLYGLMVESASERRIERP
ncbi:MAG: WYL domain-containing protein [Leptolyngbya sp. SIO4C1]|nr:WYL domain-containing protein [Leptolyngbya sp. SIO4C1]